MDKVKVEILVKDSFHWDKDNKVKRADMEKSTNKFLKECDDYIFTDAPAFIRKEFKKD